MDCVEEKGGKPSRSEETQGSKPQSDKETDYLVVSPDKINRHVPQVEVETEDVTNGRSTSTNTSQHGDDVLYDGGILEDDIEQVDYSSMFHDEFEPSIDLVENDVEIKVRGVKYRIPFAIECHLCNEMMNLCLRRTRYRGQPKEYPAYRCNRKGCQTFRSIRKVFSECTKIEAKSADTSKPSEPTTPTTPKTPKSENIISYMVERIAVPKQENSGDEQSGDRKPLTLTDRVRKANQARALVFSEFADQLRKDIAANKRVRVRKQSVEGEDQQGTLFYITKELTPNEVVDVQDAIIKTLMKLRKIPTPMTLNDLPIFANCPWSKHSVETGMASNNSREIFWSTFSRSPQPPLPEGFIKKKDDTLIYRDPRPYEVPELLQENSPRKQAEAVKSYRLRKEEQDARRNERRHCEKRYRSWASLKRDFDMAEVDTEFKFSRPNYEESHHTPKQPKTVTLQELLEKMEGESANGIVSGKIRAGSSRKPTDGMQWIDVEASNVLGEPSPKLARRALAAEYTARRLDKQDLDEYVHYDEEDGLKKKTLGSLSLHEMMMHSRTKEAKSPLLFDNSSYFQTGQGSSQYYSNVSNYSYPYEETQYGLSDVAVSSSDTYTYIHPDSGVHVTDPSQFLNSFIPSPIIKTPPNMFSERKKEREFDEVTRDYTEITDSDEKPDDVEIENKKIMDSFLKFDPPLIGDE